jgi:hypothetical protein
VNVCLVAVFFVSYFWFPLNTRLRYSERVVAAACRMHHKVVQMEVFSRTLIDNYTMPARIQRYGSRQICRVLSMRLCCVVAPAVAVH